MAAHFLETTSLKDCMDAVGVKSFRALALQSGVSRRQVEWLRQGQMSRLSVQSALRLAATLKLSLAELLHQFGDDCSLLPEYCSVKSISSLHSPPRPPILGGESQKLGSFPPRIGGLGGQVQCLCLLSEQYWAWLWVTVIVDRGREFITLP